VTIDHLADRAADHAAAISAAELGLAESGSLGLQANAEIPSRSKSEAQRQVDPMDDYVRLQQRLMMATLAVSAAAVALSWIFLSGSAAASLLLGACSGMLYLRLLARSVASLGKGSRSVGRFQLLVPVILVIAALRVPAIELLPALAGFVLYKPALLLQAVLAP
jgi:ATP synthase protein I